MSTPPLSLRQLAKRLGLAPSTVSMALNDAPTIAAATRARVQAEARRLGWRPNPLLSALLSPTGRRRAANPFTRLALLLDTEPTRRGFFGDDYWPALVAEAERLGCQIEYHNLHGVKSARALLKTLFNRGVAGLVFDHIDRPDIFDPALLRKFHITSLQSRWLEAVSLVIRYDAGEGLKLCWQRLVEQGCRRIGCCLFKHEPAILDDDHRLAALLLCQHQSPKNHPRLPPFLIDQSDPLKGFAEYLRRHRPDGLIGFSGLQTWQLRRPGVRNPELRAYAQLHVQPADGVQGIRNGADRRAEAAVRALVRMIRSGEPTVVDAAESWVLRPEWVEGERLPMVETA